MVKKPFVISMLCFSMFASCDYSEKMATFYVNNNSQYQVTDIFTPSRSESWAREILEPGESCTFIPEWVDGKAVSIPFNFTMKGEKYGARGREEAMTDTRRFKPPKRIADGDTVIVHIYDDHWEWW